jgi:hypothetical protein
MKATALKLDGLVIDRQTGKFAPYRPWSTIRLFRGGRVVADIQVSDGEQRFPVGKRLDISLEDAA